MLGSLLAAAALAAQAPVAATAGDHPPGWTPPVQIRRPSPEQLSWAWPRLVVGADALAQGKPLKVAVDIHMIDPTGPDFAARRLSAPAWTAGLDPERVQKLFPAEAVAK